MLGNYINIDSKKVVLIDSIIAILAERQKTHKSRVFLREGFYSSQTSSKKIAERLRSGKR